MEISTPWSRGPDRSPKPSPDCMRTSRPGRFLLPGPGALDPSPEAGVSYESGAVEDVMTRENPPAWAVHAMIICVAIAEVRESDENASASLGMSPAIACKAIEGYEDF